MFNVNREKIAKVLTLSNKIQMKYQTPSEQSWHLCDVGLYIRDFSEDELIELFWQSNLPKVKAKAFKSLLWLCKDRLRDGEENGNFESFKKVFQATFDILKDERLEDDFYDSDGNWNEWGTMQCLFEMLVQFECLGRFNSCDIGFFIRDKFVEVFLQGCDTVKFFMLRQLRLTDSEQSAFYEPVYALIPTVKKLRSCTHKKLAYQANGLYLSYKGYFENRY